MKLQQLPSGVWIKPASVDAVWLFSDFTCSQVRVLVNGQEFSATKTLSFDEAERQLASVVDAIHRGIAAGMPR